MARRQRQRTTPANCARDATRTWVETTGHLLSCKGLDGEDESCAERVLKRVVGEIESWRMDEMDRDELVRTISAQSAVRLTAGYRGTEVTQLCPRGLRKRLKKTIKEAVNSAQEGFPAE